MVYMVNMSFLSFFHPHIFMNMPDSWNEVGISKNNLALLPAIIDIALIFFYLLPGSSIIFYHILSQLYPKARLRYYHTWQLEWDSDFIQIRVDGETLLKVEQTWLKRRGDPWGDPVAETWQKRNMG